MAILFFWCQNVFSQVVIKPFEPRYKTEQPGGIVFVANNILTCESCNTDLSSSQNDNNNSKYIDVIADGTVTYNSSSADLNLPDCSTITFAGLYWNGSASPSNSRYADRNKVKLRMPGGSFIDLEADVEFGIFQDLYYQYFKDVTALVKANPVINGTYVVGNVVANSKEKTMEAGWTLVIAYRQELEPVRNLTVFDGFVGIPKGAPDLEIPISGFLTPPTGPVSFELGFVAYEGDASITGDYLQVNGVTVQDAVHPSNNTFNSSIASKGSIVTSRNPAHVNTLGYDASIIKLDNSSFQFLKNSATNARINMATSGDKYAVGVVTTAIDVYNPSFLFTHKYTNLAGPAAVAMGDEVEFEYELSNIGIDKSANTIFSDILPSAFQFVPGSLKVQVNNGAWSGKTDAANDDESEYLSSENRVVFRLGNGATGTKGGSIDPNTKIKIRYRARLTTDCDLLRCSAPSISKFGELTFSGTINKDKQWAVQSTPPMVSGSCPTSGPMDIALNIPQECLDLPADRSYAFDCDTEVSALGLPSGYQLFRADDNGFATPLSRVTASGSYIARRFLQTGCEYTFNVQVTINRVKILSQPASVTSCPGEEVNFQVTAEGSTGNFFQWQRYTGSAWEDVTGATGPTLRVTATAADQGARYRVVVSRGCGPSETSAEATMTVTKPALIETQPVSMSACEEEHVTFSVGATGDLISYQWQSNNGGDTWAAINGATGASVTVPAVLANTGFKYRVVISSACGPVTSDEATLTVSKKLAVTEQPVSTTVCEDQAAAFTVQAAGDGVDYQWQSSTDGTSWTDIAGADAAGFTLASASLALDGMKYRVVMENACGTLTSAAAVLTVVKKLEIQTQPVSVTVCEDETATFTVGATGSDLTYQWQTNNGGATWTNIAGSTGNSLTVPAAAAQDGVKYRAVINSTCGTLNSAEATLTVTPKLRITAQPAAITVCEDEPATFTVGATGANISYQWQSNNGTSWTDITGSTGTSLTVTAAAARNGVKYRVVVSSTCGTLNSAEAALTVTPKLRITAQPSSVTVCEDETATFSVTATGANVTYQWQSNNGGSSWLDIAGSTGTSLTVPAATAQNGFKYRVVISSTCGTLNSAEAALTITPKLRITAHPVSVTVCEDEVTTFTVGATGANVTYQWQSNNGGATWMNIAGSTGTSLTVTAAAARNGVKYRVVVSSTCGTLNSAEAALTVTPKLRITAQPSSVTVCEDEAATFTVGASGANITYQWQSNNGTSWADMAGSTGTTLTVAAAAAQNGVKYRAVINSTCGTLNSAEATLTVTSKLRITAQPVSVTVCEDEVTTFTVGATGANITYQWQSNNGGATWTNIAGSTGTTLSIPAAAAQNGFKYRMVISSTCGTLNSAEATLTVTPKLRITAQPVSVTVCEDEVATFTVGATGANITYQWQSNNGGATWTNIAGSTGTTLTVPAAAAQNGFKYRVVISSTCGTLNSAEAALTITPKLRITAQPAAITVCEDETATFTVGATGANITYQWQSNNGGATWTNIAGSTGTTLTVPAEAAQNGVKYRVVISSTCGTLNSAEATLTVTPKLRITAQPVSVTVCEDEVTTFTVGATGANVTYQWQSNNGTSWKDIAGSTGTSLTVPAAAAQNGVKYRVVISSTCGTLNSAEATLTVTPKLRITAQPVSVTVCEDEVTTFTVGATGANITYQWQSNNGGATWTNIAGSTGTTLSIPAAAAQNGFKYRMVISSTCGTLNSAEAVLTVTPRLRITGQPVSVTVCEDETATFTVGATGANVTYQWQSNNGTSWKDIAGSTGTTLAVSAAAAQNGFKYRVVIASTCGTLNSAEASLIVHKQTVITGQPVPVTRCEGADATFHIQADGANLVYQWQSSNGGNTWTPLPGATGARLDLTNIKPDQHGNLYRVLVEGACGSVTSEAAMLSVARKPVIVKQPVSLTVCDGAEATFEAGATGESLTYQWQINEGSDTWMDLAGEISGSLTVKASKQHNGRFYRALITGPCGTIASVKVFAWAQECQKAEIISGPVSLAVCAGDPVVFSVQATGENIRYQWQSKPAGSASWTDIEQATGATLDLGRAKYSQNGTAYRVVIRTSSGTLESAQATLTVNAIPNAKPDYFKVDAQTLNGRVDGNDSDADQDPLSFALVSAPEHGTWKLSLDGSFTYIPEAGWSGTTTGRYSVTDGKCTVTAEVTFNVTAIPPVSNDDNDGKVQPAAEDDFFKTDVDKPVSGSVGRNDAIDQIQNPVFTATSEPANGTVKFLPDGSFTYTPKKGFTGKDTFTYRVCTPEGLCSSARVEITVVPYTVVNLTPGLSTVREGGQISITATLEKAFNEDVVIRLSYKGKAERDSDYELSEQFQTIRIPKGQQTTSERIRIFASPDNLQEDAEDVVIEIAGTSHNNVRIGSGAVVIIQDSQSSDPGSSPDSKYPEPLPLVSPNGDNNNDYFQIRNIENFPNNEVVIFNRWGNEVFRTKGYNPGNGNVFRGLANRGLQLGNNDNLPDGVYYYLITPDTSRVQAASDLLKGYLILKRD